MSLSEVRAACCKPRETNVVTGHRPSLSCAKWHQGSHTPEVMRGTVFSSRSSTEHRRGQGQACVLLTECGLSPNLLCLILKREACLCIKAQEIPATKSMHAGSEPFAGFCKTNLSNGAGLMLLSWASIWPCEWTAHPSLCRAFEAGRGDPPSLQMQLWNSSVTSHLT